MAKVFLSPEQREDLPEFGVFRRPKAGVGTPFEITGSIAIASKTSQASGIGITMDSEDESGNAVKHTERFWLTGSTGNESPWGMAAFKKFGEKLGFPGEETFSGSFDADSMAGIRFVCDVSHVPAKVGDFVEVKLNYNTIIMDDVEDSEPEPEPEPVTSKPARPKTRGSVRR